MTRQRRQKLQRVLAPLVQLKRFSVQEAKRECAPATPRYVTQTIRELVREGVLQKSQEAGVELFYWVQESPPFEMDAWIERQIHGDQVTQTPIQERPRERLLRDGPEALSNADLLAILIRVGVKGESAVVGGRKIANRFDKRLPELRKQTVGDLKQISPAISKANYAQVMAGIELGRRVAKSEANQQRNRFQITCSRTAIEYCRAHFENLAADGIQEEFHIVSLDTKHKPIRTHRITVGTLNASLVHPREVFRPAIRDAAAAMLMVHNHPSGDPTPSSEDLEVTRRLTEAGELLGIDVLDHIIVASERAVSVRETMR